MAEENDSVKHDFHEHYHDRKMGRGHSGSGIMGAAYFMAFIGAAVYYIQQTGTALEGFIGFLKAVVWPAMLVFDLFKYLNA